MKARQRPNDVCPKDCQQRSPTCHGECEKYLNYHGQQREKYKKRLEAAAAETLTIDSVRKSIEGTDGNWNAYRPGKHR